MFDKVLVICSFYFYDMTEKKKIQLITHQEKWKHFGLGTWASIMGKKYSDDYIFISYPSVKHIRQLHTHTQLNVQCELKYILKPNSPIYIIK